MGAVGAGLWAGLGLQGGRQVPLLVEKWGLERSGWETGASEITDLTTMSMEKMNA